MKTIKRIIVVTLLVVVGILVGCFTYTGNRLKAYPNDISAFTGNTYAGEKNTLLSFHTEKEIVYVVGESVVSLEISEYVDGVIYATSGEKEYRFTAVDGMLYDEQTEQFLVKRGGDG